MCWDTEMSSGERKRTETDQQNRNDFELNPAHLIQLDTPNGKKSPPETSGAGCHVLRPLRFA